MTTSSLALSQQLLIGELPRRAAHRAPDKEAFVCENRRLTFRELEERVLHLAGWLQRQQHNRPQR
ncbi:MAG: hypothetical protein QJR06_10205 [Alicyclobacillaceae bacterium]|nr:hypothetical protein [Alicyclobacillaceae bacterium]